MPALAEPVALENAPSTLNLMAVTVPLPYSPTPLLPYSPSPTTNVAA